MPFFRFPFQYNPYYYARYNHNNNLYSNNKKQTKDVEDLNINNSSKQIEDKKNNSKSNKDDYFFELFGLKLYLDDIIIISLLFFLYTEGVKDDELFISLILLLLT